MVLPFSISEQPNTPLVLRYPKSLRKCGPKRIVWRSILLGIEVGMRVLRKVLAFFLTSALLAYGQGNTFTKVRYNGGSVASHVDPKDWDNKLIVSPDAITLETKDKVKVDIPPKSVTSLSYGQEAHRRVGTMVALAILVAPVALFGLFHKTRLHYIGIQYNTPDGKNSGILLQGDKDNYRAILVALQGVSGAPVSVSEKDRSFVPVGVSTSVAKDAVETQTVAETKSTAATTDAGGIGTVAIATVPDGGEIYSDDQFCGNAPATVKLKPGKHTVRVKMAGFKEWSREISVGSGSEAHLTATLEKSN
jgi:PEGA domain